MLVRHTDPILHKPAEYVTVFDASLEKLLEDMMICMFDKKAVGLAAPQIGVPKRIAIVQTPDMNPNTIFVFINPEIVLASGELQTELEGCLSFEGVTLPIERKNRCTVTYDNVHGKRLSVELGGLQARAAQHEIDHLNGITFLDRVGPLAKSKAMKDLKRYENDQR